MRQLDIFRQLHHVCVIVQDLDTAVAYYESLAVGPWHDYPSLEPYELEVKDPTGLCEPGEGDTPQRRFLEERGEGVRQDFQLQSLRPPVSEPAMCSTMGCRTCWWMRALSSRTESSSIVVFPPFD